MRPSWIDFDFVLDPIGWSAFYARESWFTRTWTRSSSFYYYKHITMVLVNFRVKPQNMCKTWVPVGTWEQKKNIWCCWLFLVFSFPSYNFFCCCCIYREKRLFLSFIIINYGIFRANSKRKARTLPAPSTRSGSFGSISTTHSWLTPIWTLTRHGLPVKYL